MLWDCSQEVNWQLWSLSLQAESAGIKMNRWIALFYILTEYLFSCQASACAELQEKILGCTFLYARVKFLIQILNFWYGIGRDIVVFSAQQKRFLFIFSFLFFHSSQAIKVLLTCRGGNIIVYPSILVYAQIKVNTRARS